MHLAASGIIAAGMKTLPINLPMDELKDFCERWRIKELAVFGSVLRDDFGTDSDVDFLYTFEEGAGWSLFDVVDMKDQLREIVGRRVDFVSRKGIESSHNPYRKNAILSLVEVVYASR